MYTGHQYGWTRLRRGVGAAWGGRGGGAHVGCREEVCSLLRESESAIEPGEVVGWWEGEVVRWWDGEMELY